MKIQNYYKNIFNKLDKPKNYSSYDDYVIEGFVGYLDYNLKFDNFCYNIKFIKRQHKYITKNISVPIINDLIIKSIKNKTKSINFTYKAYILDLINEVGYDRDFYATNDINVYIMTTIVMNDVRKYFIENGFKFEYERLDGDAIYEMRKNNMVESYAKKLGNDYKITIKL